MDIGNSFDGLPSLSHAVHFCDTSHRVTPYTPDTAHTRLCHHKNNPNYKSTHHPQWFLPGRPSLRDRPSACLERRWLAFGLRRTLDHGRFLPLRCGGLGRIRNGVLCGAVNPLVHNSREKSDHGILVSSKPWLRFDLDQSTRKEPEEDRHGVKWLLH